MIVGHHAVREHLEDELPPVTLLSGPPSIGKRTLCEHLAAHHGVKKGDVLRYVSDPFSVDDAREVQRFLSTRPMGKLKVVVVRLDRASSEALNALLKVLEEPPRSARFLLTSAFSTLLTVESRARVFRMGYLAEDDVYQILHEKIGQSPAQARAGARVAGGQVQRALDVGDVDIAKGPVLSLLKAAADSDEELMLNALAKFEAPQAELLKAWTIEARTGMWRTFNSSEGYGLQSDRWAVDRIARAMTMGARPRIAAKLAVLEIMEERRARLRPGS